MNVLHLDPTSFSAGKKEESPPTINKGYVENHITSTLKNDVGQEKWKRLSGKDVWIQPCYLLVQIILALNKADK